MYGGDFKYHMLSILHFSGLRNTLNFKVVYNCIKCIGDSALHIHAI